MADYYSLLHRAIAGLPEQTSEKRTHVYERARTALVNQLRNIEPAMPEADITRERLALEEAIRRLEQDHLKGKPAAPPAKPSLEKPASPPPLPLPPKPNLEAPVTEKPPPAKLPPLPEVKPQPSIPPSRVRFDSPQEKPQSRKGLIYGLLGGFGLLAAALGGWFMLSGAENEKTTPPPKPAITQVTPPPVTPPSTKSNERVQTDQPATSQPQQPQAQTVRNEGKAVLFEEAQSGMNAHALLEGQAKWSLETVNTPNSPAETAVVARVNVPERKMSVEMRFRRNLDQTLPASHTIELTFTYPQDATTSPIANIPGLLMKTGEQTRGQPLAGLAVKVTGNFFLIGLSSSDADILRNVQILREWGWFDIPIEFENRRRAILSIEKGSQGERILNDALTQWGR